ncbi:hypothetical protein M4D58_23785 [Brevibacillus borstelensis]|uniref:hypothetical protein n=1 Tax=Brevibacillus borstelensis TaxID=45462 RepID=UPI00203E4317|nr:hypothetical protein [Brevibacillus borstelensis]MCM3593647.1 hypothetical protein [Brevibacillus borstelensis]
MAGADKLQQVIGDDLFPNVQSISDVKQVLDFMQPVSQPLREEQVRAILYLQDLGSNQEMHPGGNPYEKLIKAIVDYREKIADPEFYIDTIEALVPKPPRPILMTGDGNFKKVQPAK